MTFTYDPTKLQTTTDPNQELYQVRFEIGDTDSTDILLQDEEINFVISIETTLKYAAAACCDRVAAHFARKVQKSVGPLSLAAQQKFDQYTKLAADIRSRAGSMPVPYAGGISVSDINNRRQNTDANQGSFTTDLHEPEEGADHLSDAGPLLPAAIP